MIHTINRHETDLIIGADFYGSNIRYLSKPFSDEVTAFRQVYFRGFKAVNVIANVDENIKGVLPEEPYRIKHPIVGEGISRIYFPECLVRRTLRMQEEITNQNIQEMVLESLK